MERRRATRGWKLPSLLVASWVIAGCGAFGSASDSNNGLRLERGGTEAEGDADTSQNAGDGATARRQPHPDDRVPCGPDPIHEACWAECAEANGLNACGEAAADACNAAFEDAEAVCATNMDCGDQKRAAEEACMRAREACAQLAMACQESCPLPPPDPRCAPQPDPGCARPELPPSPECLDAVRSFDECNQSQEVECADERQALEACVQPRLEQCESDKRALEECWMTMGDCRELEQTAMDSCSGLEACRPFEEAVRECHSACEPLAGRIAETCPPKPCEPVPPPCGHDHACQPMPPTPECEAAVRELEQCKVTSDFDCQDELVAADECMRPLVAACEQVELALKSCFESGQSDCDIERRAAEECYQRISDACVAEHDAVNACFEACRDLGDRVARLCPQPCQPPRPPPPHECDPNGMNPDGRPCPPPPPPPPDRCDPNGVTPDGRPCQPPPSPSPECQAAIQEVEACHAQQSLVCAAESAALEECVRPVLEACEQLRNEYGECVQSGADCAGFEERMSACLDGMAVCRPLEQALRACMEPCREAAERAHATCDQTPWPDGPRG